MFITRHLARDLVMGFGLPLLELLRVQGEDLSPFLHFRPKGMVSDFEFRVHFDSKPLTRLWLLMVFRHF